MANPPISSDISEDWYRSFFTHDFNEFWRRAVPPESTATEADFVRSALQVAPPAHLLDVPCGSGRHSVALARLGYRVTGIDLSEDAIAHATAADSTATFHRADMRNLPDGPFDGVLCLGNSFGYLPDDAMAAFVASLARVLKRGARLVLDSAMVAEALFPNWQDGRAHRLGDIAVESRAAYDARHGRATITYRLTRGDAVTERSISHRVYSAREIVSLLDAHGLVVEALWASTDGTPFCLGSSRLWLVARRE